MLEVEDELPALKALGVFNFKAPELISITNPIVSTIKKTIAIEKP